MGRRRKTKGRPVNGILLLDKPAGITSNQALQHVKHLFQAQKAGHTGSLDKSATGLLPLCLGEATKFSAFLLEADKHYQAVCKLGAETATGDAEGEVTLQYDVPEFTRSEIESVLSMFIGEIQQVPPMYSALKQNGQPLYKLAYAGKEVKREARQIRIDEIVLEDFTADTISISVKCSKGTYIRTLAQDIGRKLGCGAYIKSLRRVASGPFLAEQMLSMSSLENLATQGTEELDKLLLPIDAVVAHMPSVNLLETVSYYLRQGQAVMVPHAPTDGMLRIYSENQRFLGIGEVLEDGRVAPKRLVNF